MKKLIIVIALTFPLVLNAQVFFKMDAGLGAGLMFGDMSAYGIMAHTEPKVFILPSLSAGLRIEGDALFGGKITDAAEDLNVGLTTRAAILLKGEYYLTKGKTRPFVGLAVGRYTIANTSASGTGSAGIQAGNHFGFGPEIGVTFNNFRLSAMYHMINEQNIVEMEASSPKEVSMNYLVVGIGFKVFSAGN